MFSNDEIQSVVSVIQKGGIILYPTDTVWGIGCDPFNSDAVNKLLVVKQQDFKKGFVLLVNDQEMLKKYVPKVEPKIQNLLDYHIRPVTVVYDKAVDLPDYLLAKDGSVAIRITQDAFCQELITKLGTPLISTIANISNEPIPKIFNEISAKIIQQMDYVVQHRQNDTKKSTPSVIITLSSKEEMIFLRK